MSCYFTCTLILIVFIASLQIILFLRHAHMCNPMVKGLRKSFVSLERIFYMSPSQLCKKFYHVWPRFKVHLHSFHVFTQTYLSELSSWFISKGWDLSWHNCCLWHCLWQHCSARGVWGHCSPRIFWKMEVARMCFPPFWAEMWCDWTGICHYMYVWRVHVSGLQSA